MSIVAAIGMISDLISLNGRRSLYEAFDAIAKVFLLASMLSLGSCGEDPRIVIEIVTREGATFIVVEPEANYERVCTDGQYSLRGDPDKQGLRSVSADADNRERSHSYDEIPWATINSISFAEPIGDLGREGGEYCSGPVSIAATVHLKNGVSQSHKLVDTTDLGITGKSERGKIVIAIREIAGLRRITDENWSWAKSDNRLITNDDLPTLLVTTTDGRTREFWAPASSVTRDKHYGKYTLRGPDHPPPGLPALIAGACIAIPWNSISRVEFVGNRLPLPGQSEIKLAAHLVYADGHSENENVYVPDNSGFSTTAKGGDSVEFRDIVRIELEPKARTNR